MAFPTTAAITALVAIAPLAFMDRKGQNQIVPGIDSKAPSNTNIGVQALIASAACGAVGLYMGGMTRRDSIGRGLLYAAGAGAILGTGLVVQGETHANTLRLQGKTA